MARKMKTMDGNNAAAHVSYAFTEVAAIFPITPSSVMAEVTDVWSAGGKTNLFGEKVRVVEMQSEAGAAGAVHGSLAAGALTTTYTASQGLLLMIPNMYKMAGELLPAVIHVSARAVASHALSIFGDHSDIYACRQTGFGFLCAGNVQETMDLGAIAHLAAIKSRVPFLHFFDGFRTSHEVQKIEVWDDTDLAEMLDLDAVAAFRNRSLSPERPVLRGSAQNPDIFFQAREAGNPYYDALPAVVEEYMGKVNAKIGTDYKLFNYYGAVDAEHVIIAMGSVCDTIEETIDYLNAKGGKYGLIKVRLYRPFVAEKLVAAIPASAKTLTVLDRTKEPGSIGEPLYLDVILGIRESKFGSLPVYSGRYGLGSKDTNPSHIIAVYRNAESGAIKRFTVGINDDVTNLSLPINENPDTAPKGTTACKFWGLGSDGTVGANKNSIKIIGDHTDMYAQAYFSYDSKKSGGVTVSHLRFGKTPIRSTYLINKADFVACHNVAYIDKYDMVTDIKPGGTFLLACGWNQKELDEKLPGTVKKYIADNDIKFYCIDAVSTAQEIGLGNRLNTILQAAFFKLANIIPIEDAVRYMKDAATKSYSKRGDDVVKMNHNAIDAGLDKIVKIDVPASWKSASGGSFATAAAKGNDKTLIDFVNNIAIPANAQRGDSIPVSAFADRADGTLPLGTAAFEKRGVAVDVPQWIPENCIQCGFCSYVCPHAVIRPLALNEKQAAAAPAEQQLLDMTGMPGYKFGMSISTLDCQGCASCANICPGKKGEKALVMKPIASQMDSQKGFEYGLSVETDQAVFDKFKVDTVKGSQLRQPLLEFSGACAGCGETPYAKLVTQMFGSRMYIANATGCSSIWGGSAPSTPYTTNKQGKGPAWANSLFEDNAEFGYGMLLGQRAVRERLIKKVEALVKTASGDLKAACEGYLASKDDADANTTATQKLIAALEGSKSGAAKEILAEKDYLNKKSIFIFGGDGWAYDIGYGGLDHVLASGENVNIVVFDTEVYSNTGGQSSKATQTGAVAQFAAAGKEVKKKDLAAISMSYGYIYVAQVAMGADYNQCIKAFAEAEAYDGPSLVICYSPCIAHGNREGMGKSQTTIKNAVASGYWHMFRFDPRRVLEGKNPFQLDSKAPTLDYEDFIKSEVRYSSLETTFPDRADELFENAAINAGKKYDALVKRAKTD
jgi:pyruvate-ferredoxin/flavodoxin oxidoreductase